MNWKTKYNIAFKGLSEGEHKFEFQVDGRFFEHFEGSLVDNGEAEIKVTLEKRSAFLKLHIKIKGWVELVCDRCLDNYQQKIKHKTEIFVKFGEQEFEDGENVIWVLPEEHHISLAQIFYEYIMLSIPLRHVHPKNDDGKRECNKEMLKKLKDYMSFPAEEEEQQQIDPRWEALRKLGNNN
ncbi:YceD family protein [Maribellus comscasis]|uniref:YceD family protein n=1 Tax=Maribellus comscasis TaxID=2681766 RepID=UPI00131D14AB|nr:DUF177 domain-containing protein [Maribellus comscasis]